MSIPDQYERKISTNGQIILPTPYRISDEWYVPEPGVIYSEDKVRFYSTSKPPVWEGPFPGEQLKVSLTNQGQITIPVRFRRKAGLLAGDSVNLSRDLDAGYIELEQPSSTDAE